MAKVFISHRNVEPDLGLAKALRAALAPAHDVFLDAENILPGDEWPKVIQKEMEDADVLVALLSESIAESPEMVTEEVAMAREMRQDGGRPRIVPVLLGGVAFACLPYDLRAMVRRVQCVSWRDDSGTATLLDQLQRVLGGEEIGDTAPRADEAAVAVAGRRQPPKAAYSADWYVERPAVEKQAGAYLAKAGAPVVLFGPAEIGKSYSLEHLVESHREDGDIVLRINLEYLAQDGAADDLLKDFAWEVAEQLDLDDESVERAWKSKRPARMKLTRWMRSCVLPRTEKRTFLAVDRADVLVRGKRASDLLAVLRTWADTYRERPPWDRLRILMAVSTDPELLKEENPSSPFNLTDPIHLGDFDAAQVEEMARRYGLDWTGEIGDLMSLVGGHPYLVRKVMYAAAPQDRSLAGLLADSIGERGLFNDYLSALTLKIRRDEALATAIVQVLDRNAEGLDYEVVQRLLRAGLLRGHPGAYAIRYRLFSCIFASGCDERR